jgi:hypothetical protein
VVREVAAKIFAPARLPDDIIPDKGECSWTSVPPGFTGQAGCRTVVQHEHVSVRLPSGGIAAAPGGLASGSRRPRTTGKSLGDSPIVMNGIWMCP